ncbi:hypothetical protein IVB41_12200 [Bradyrhizobium sp. 44]|uniref:hypothetical protein n=1 Tax=Bradyrhizobium sp. 44 TaxID=2782675 RepID=UPI001FFACD83|nr:hypothetical protein [Bradyrhizobium sp. 44]MCK1284680.1 hypothetical protein [Bradyrhizobium sp. 44]
MLDDEFLRAIANTSAEVHLAAPINPITGNQISCPVLTAAIVRNQIAERRSGSNVPGFYRPGERAEDGVPFDVEPEKPPPYHGPPVDHATDKISRTWYLQEEYFAGRLGDHLNENGRNWATAQWLDRIYSTATLPANATATQNFLTGVAQKDEGAVEGDFAYDEEPTAGETEELNFDKKDKRKLRIDVPDFQLSQLIDACEELDEVAKLDASKLARRVPSLPTPDQLDRAEAQKLLRMIIVGTRSLWWPLKRAMFHNATMKSLGKGDSANAPAAGRQRVVEGLRYIYSVKRNLARHDRGFSLWLARIRRDQVPVISKRFKVPSVDEIIDGTLAVLPDFQMLPEKAPPGRYWNQARGAVIKLDDRKLVGAP